MATSVESRSSELALDRPFDRAVLARAKAIAGQYKIVLEFEDGEWYGHGLEMPTVFGDGKTPQAAVRDTREALVTTVAYLLEKGDEPPAPAKDGERSVRVDVRLTAEEKDLLETRARSKGFRGLSEFIRAPVLAEK